MRRGGKGEKGREGERRKGRGEQLHIVKWEVGYFITVQCGWLHFKLLCVQ